MAKIILVGVGPGSPDYVTPAARKAVQQAQVVIGAQRSLRLFAPDIKCQIMVLTAKNLNEAMRYAVDSAKEGKNVALLSTGDPGFSGLLHTILKNELFDTVELTVIPGISSIQASAARLALSWDDARLYAFHDGDVTSNDKNDLAQSLKNGKDVLILPDPKAFSPKEISNFLIKAGLDEKTIVEICENITLDDEKVTSLSLDEVAKSSFGSLCVMVIKADRNSRRIS